MDTSLSVAAACSVIRFCPLFPFNLMIRKPNVIVTIELNIPASSTLTYALER